MEANMSDAVPLPALENIRNARRALTTSGLPRTPCLELHYGRRRAGRLFVKAENLLPTGSFKIRGATYRISRLTLEEKRRGVVAYSTGNHAQAVAKAARDQDLPVTIVMSPDVLATKVAATKRWGAQVVNAAPSSEARRKLAEQLATERGLVIVPPYDDLDVIAGQGTIGLELIEDLQFSMPTTVYVPIGGGGLISGVAAALKQIRPDVRVVGVEPESENDAFLSFRERRIVALPGPSDSIADAIKVQQLGKLTFPAIRHFVDDIELVSEAEIARAVLMAADEMKMIVEPGGAVGLAAAARAAQTHPGQFVAILGGGNMPMERLEDMRALVATGNNPDQD
jgi:threonine dehydratase